ncbi:GspE/PulE family protein [Miltoncostaea marina]|uniref:GspE/PulE family protein n=1 Tax=Miltoncostaea marina TaxID=2843215 RepID=UPI001C3CD51E|nr:ATPase, T2SS/T4P/T4SS family [Miltoncostaea marina]
MPASAPAAGAPPPAGRAAPARPPRGEPLGRVLVRMGALSEEQLEDAAARQLADGRKLGELLVAEELITRDQLARAMALRMGVDFFTLADGVDPALSRLIDEKSARRYQAVPVRTDADGTLVVAMADPSNVFAIDDLRILTRHEIRPVLASAEEIRTLLGQMSAIDAVVADLVGEGGHEADEGDGADIADVLDDAPVVRLVNSVIARGVDERASDIHLEPQAHEMTVRYRVDGVLRTVTSVPHRLANGVASRIKIMADLDIAERRVPQDGRVGITVGGRPLDLRVATLPTVYGEKIVMRILDKSNVLMRLSDLGFAKDVLARFEACYRRPYGAILVTGPTGSGKSTSLYGALNQLNSADKNIITVEDPVEYRLPGINQVQVNPRAGLTFAAGLRSILRCDPDIVMIGEIRDHETARIAIESALTGHLVLATLHTNDAAGALTRLSEMGVEPYLSASAVTGILAQRLARRLCSHCKAPVAVPLAELRETMGVATLPPGLPDPVAIHRPVGCPRCQETGYRGRLGVYEMLVMSEATERMTVAGATSEEITAQARREGMRTLREDGVLKVLAGHTSIEEVARAVG